MSHFLKNIPNISTALYIDNKIVVYCCDLIQKYYYNSNSLEERLLFAHGLLRCMSPKL